MSDKEKAASSLKRKISGTVLSFAISMAFFILIRIAGVSYFLDLFVDIVNFNPTSALNFLVWIGTIVILTVAFLVLNLAISMDKLKLNLDIIFSGLISIGIMFLYAYNYVGYNYSYLFAGVSLFERFIYLPYWLTIFAVYGLPDIFYFWMITAIIFFILVGIFINLDLKDIVRIKLFGKRKKEMRYKELGIKHFVASFLFSVLISAVMFLIIQLISKQILIFDLLSLYGIITFLVFGFAMSFVFYVSIKITSSDANALVVFMIFSSLLTFIVFNFVVMIDLASKIIIIVLLNLITFMILIRVVKKL